MIRNNTGTAAKVLLKDAFTGLYYAGQHLRTVDPLSAFDFPSIDQAGRRALEEDLAAMRIVLNYESPACQLSIPVNPEWLHLESLPVAVH